MIDIKSSNGFTHSCVCWEITKLKKILPRKSEILPKNIAVENMYYSAKKYRVSRPSCNPHQSNRSNNTNQPMTASDTIPGILPPQRTERIYVFHRCVGYSLHVIFLISLFSVSTGRACPSRLTVISAILPTHTRPVQHCSFWTLAHSTATPRPLLRAATCDVGTAILPL